MSSRRFVVTLAGALVWMVAAPLWASPSLTMEEALALAFPDCSVERATVYLTSAQLATAKDLAGVEIASALLHPYRATCDGVRSGTAYFDAHTVRTLPETLMVVVDAAGKVARIEVLAFREPPDYLPRSGWYAQFVGKRLDSELGLAQGVRAVAGATLTARATTAAVRRILALHQVVEAQQP